MSSPQYCEWNPTFKTPDCFAGWDLTTVFIPIPSVQKAYKEEMITFLASRGMIITV